MMRRPLRALVIVTVLATAAAPARVGADDPDDELRRVAARIESVAEMIDDVTASRSSLAAEVVEAQNELATLVGDLAIAEAALSEIRSTVARQSDSLESVRVHLSNSYTGLSATRTAIVGQRAAAREGARAAYINRARDLTALSLSARTITGISIGVEYLRRATGKNASAISALLVLEKQEGRQQASIADEEAQSLRDLAALELLERDLDVAYADIEKQRVGYQDHLVLLARLLETLDTEIAHFESELDGLHKEQRGIKRRIAAEQTTTIASVSLSGFVRPVPGTITSAYGPRFHPIVGTYRPHTGVDMAASRGQAIKAVKGGTVILAGTWGGYGRTIVIDHGGGLSTLYAHQNSLLVSYGDSVEAGKIIGRVGTSGVSTGPHLHFEVRVGGDPVDPAPYLGG